MTADTDAAFSLSKTVTSEGPVTGMTVDVARIRNKVSKELAGMHWYGPFAESETFHYLNRNGLLDFFDIEIRQLVVTTTEWEHADIDRAVAAVKAAGTVTKL